MAPVDDGGSILEKIQRETGIPLPTWAIGILSGLVLVGAVVAVVKPLLPGLAALVRSAARWFGRRRQDQRRAQRRARFANYIEGQMRRLGEKEEWRDNQYAELEAEVEVREEGRHRWFLRSRAEVRRLPSLSKALETIPHRLVLLEGDPGSGKSVALRHLTQLMCLRLVRRPSEDEPIPLYINLKEFRPAGATVSAADVREYVLASVNRGRNRDIDRYVDDEFDKGVQDGTWLFLFDSFDEIPAILSAIEANETIERYSDALYDFLHGMGACRGVVASREFRGPPRRYNWPKFTIVPLTWARKVELIRKADLDATVEQSLIDDLRDAPAELRSLSDNPMFLGLLCEHVRDGNTFPATAHVVTESYVSERFSRDTDRIRDIYAVEPDLVRDLAEELAFRIASEQALGLTVERRAVVSLLTEHLNLSAEEVEAGLDALEYTKLARSSEDSSITFSHRRIQEYFATRVVLREASRVNTSSLVLDGRWRETAVTFLQVQDEPRVREVIEVVAANLVMPGDEPFTWQTSQFHLLAILADGGGYAMYPRGFDQLSEKVDAILTAAWESRSRRNQRWTLEVCSAATPELALRFIREAFAGDSEWLREEAYSQARRVRQVTVEIEREIRQTLLDFSISGELRRSHRSIRAQVCRIANPTDLLNAIRLLRLVPVVDSLALAALFAVILYHRDFSTALSCLFTVSFMWILPRLPFARLEGNRSWWMRSARRRLGFGYSFGYRERAGGARVRILGALFLLLLRALPILFLAFRDDLDRYLALSVVVVVIVPGFWLVGALIAVRDGRWLSPVRWPFLCVLLVADVVRIMRPVKVRGLLKFALGIVAWILGITMLIAAVPWLVDNATFVAVLLGIAFVLFGIASVVLVSGFALMLLAALVESIVVSHRDRVRAELTGAESEVDVTWLVGRLAVLRQPGGVLSLLRNLQTASPKPEWTADALAWLGSISRQAELYVSSGDKEVRTQARAAFDELWQPYGVARHPPLDTFVASEVLDEIGRIEDESYTTR